MVLAILSVLLFTSGNLRLQSSIPQTVEYVDLKKYAGLWYEIAKIPNSFQDQCVSGTTAKYTISENGEILVVNSCIDEDGEIDKAEGVARVFDKNTNAKLEVSFVSFLGWRPFWGDYWIIGLDENYQWAVVGHPERKYGWILSRVKKPDQETMDKIFRILKEQGYNSANFEMTLQK
jgi:apolipoprotein D and lipocalin family protein